MSGGDMSGHACELGALAAGSGFNALGLAFVFGALTLGAGVFVALVVAIRSVAGKPKRKERGFDRLRK